MTLSSQQNLLTAWSLFLSQRQQFFNNHLARVPVTHNLKRKHEMRHEVLSSVGAQEAVSADLNDVEFYWEKDQLDLDAVF